MEQKQIGSYSGRLPDQEFLPAFSLSRARDQTKKLSVPKESCVLKNTVFRSSAIRPISRVTRYRLELFYKTIIALSSDLRFLSRCDTDFDQRSASLRPRPGRAAFPRQDTGHLLSKLNFALPRPVVCGRGARVCTPANRPGDVRVYVHVHRRRGHVCNSYKGKRFRTITSSDKGG